MPQYISFERLLADVAEVLGGGDYRTHKKGSKRPEHFDRVNYRMISNKDGKLAWRELEVMHPAIYVSLVNLICDRENWETITNRFAQYDGGLVECCSIPMISSDHQTDTATQIRSWWQRLEQRSLTCSLEFSYLVQADVSNCYGSLYTHSISWAIDGVENSKRRRGSGELLGNTIDEFIRAGRYGQTNGISQGSVLMDFIAELVLGFVDQQITDSIGDRGDVRLLRYRDDYRILAANSDLAEEMLKIISDKLRMVGMSLNVAKTASFRNVVGGSVKPDKLAGIELQDLGTANAKTIQKQLLRLHAFGQRFPNSGALRRLISELYDGVVSQQASPDDLDVQVAIATDIAYVSPATIPAVAGILSHLISLAPGTKKNELWDLVRRKMRRVPYNGYLEIWLQRVIRSSSAGMSFESDEPICKIVNGETLQLWESGWVASGSLMQALDATNIVVARATDADEVVQPNEVRLFKESAWAY